MVSQDVTVINKVGVHARPASLLVNSAKMFTSEIMVSKGDKAVDLRSVMNLLRLQIKEGDVITITAEGTDEQQALGQLVTLIESKFGEE